MYAKTDKADTSRRGRAADVFDTDEERRLYEEIPAAVDHVPDPSFDSPGVEEELFGDSAPVIHVRAWAHFAEVPEEVEPRQRRSAALKSSEEAVLFLRYNYARRHLGELAVLQNHRFSVRRAKEMVLWFRRAKKVESDLVGANMALVLAMAKRTRIPNVDFTELISEGSLALLRSVEKFDVSRGYKFSTYACRSILKSFNRLATKTGRYRQRFPTEYDPSMERSDYDERKHEIHLQHSIESLREILAENRAKLTDVEQTIINERFAVASGGPRRTLAEVGRLVGLTNERVRQLQNNALGKLRAVLNADYLVA